MIDWEAYYNDSPKWRAEELRRLEAKQNLSPTECTTLNNLRDWAATLPPAEKERRS